MTQQMERHVAQGLLADEPLSGVLQRLGDGRASGALVVWDLDGETGRVDLDEGLVTGATARVPALASRLVSSAVLTPEVLDFLEHGPAAAGLPSNEESARLLGEYGCADRNALGAAVSELVHDAVGRLCEQTAGGWEFRAAPAGGGPADERAGAGTPMAELVPRLEQRRREWSALAAAVGGADAVPSWSAAGPRGRLDNLSSDSWALLCCIDGERRFSELAWDCGFTWLEAGRALLALTHRGLVQLPVPAAGPADPDENPGPTPAVLRPATSTWPAQPRAAAGAVPAPRKSSATASLLLDQGAPAALLREPADTASLLRELSSLGLEDEPVPAGRLPSRQPVLDRKTKRRTLFSR